MKKILSLFNQPIIALTVVATGTVIVISLPSRADVDKYGLERLVWDNNTIDYNSYSVDGTRHSTYGVEETKSIEDLKNTAMEPCFQSFTAAEAACSTNSYKQNEIAGAADLNALEAAAKLKEKNSEMNEGHDIGRGEFLNASKLYGNWNNTCSPLLFECLKKCKFDRDNDSAILTRWQYGQDYYGRCSTEFKTNMAKARKNEASYKDAAGQSLIGKIASEGGKMIAQNPGMVWQGLQALGSKLFGKKDEKPDVKEEQLDVKKEKKTCRQNPESPRCRCIMMGFNAPGCNPFEGRDLDRAAVGRNDDPDFDKMLRDSLVANEIKDSPDTKAQGPGGRLEPGGGLDKGSGVGKGGELDDGKPRGGGSNLASEVEVKQNSTRGYTQALRDPNQRREDRYGLLNDKKKDQSLQLSKLMPHGERDPAASYALEVSGSSGLSNFEKIRRKMKARCPYMKNDYCI